MKVGDCSIEVKEDKSMDLKSEAEGLALMCIIGLILFIALVA